MWLLITVSLLSFLLFIFFIFFFLDSDFISFDFSMFYPVCDLKTRGYNISRFLLYSFVITFVTCNVSLKIEFLSHVNTLSVQIENIKQ